MLLHYQIRIYLSDHSKFDMDWNLFLQNCFYIKLRIMFIRMFDVQYWKSNNICNTWKPKKGKTKNLNVVYLLKRINGLCNFNFYFKKHFSKIFNPPPKLEGRGCKSCILYLLCISLETPAFSHYLKSAIKKPVVYQNFYNNFDKKITKNEVLKTLQN